jgi:hypothetical protein
MPAYNFQARFAPLIRSIKKRSTFRVPRKDGRVQKVGEPVVCYTGMRTKACKRIAGFECAAVLRVAICSEGVYVNSAKVATREQSNRYARRDGFKNYAEMLAFMRGYHGVPVYGYLIEW